MTDTEPDWEKVLAPEPKLETPERKAPRTRTTKGGAGNRIRQAVQEAEPAPKSRREGIIGFCQMIALPMLFTPNTQLDAAAIMIHAPELGEAGAELAANDPRAAKIIDFVIQSGPYAGFASILLKVGLQIAANHGVIQAEPFAAYGIMTEAQIMERVANLLPSLNGERATTSPASPN